jgi:hypothetical protein
MQKMFGNSSSLFCLQQILWLRSLYL